MKNLRLWNKAIAGKYIWDTAHKSDNLWVRWVHHCLKKWTWWDHTRGNDTCSYWKKIHRVEEPKVGLTAFWSEQAPQNGICTVNSGYDRFHGDQWRVPWDKMVWNRGSIPEHSFILWILLLKVPTAERLATFREGTDTQAVLCVSQAVNLWSIYFSYVTLLSLLEGR